MTNIEIECLVAKALMQLYANNSEEAIVILEELYSKLNKLSG